VLLHSDGQPATAQCVAVARLMEEPRIEGLMARDADRIGAHSLGWTMRASAAHLMPMTTLATDPDQQIMDLITSWALRAGRQYALEHHTDHALRGWVQNFTTLLYSTFVTHLTAAQDRGADTDPMVDAQKIINGLIAMTGVTDDTGPTMIDTARVVLDLLFPETDPSEEGQPMPGSGCAESSDEDEAEQDEAEQDESAPSEDGEPDKGEDPTEDEAGEGEGEPEAGEGEAEPEAGEGEAEPGATASTGTEEGDQSELAKALASMEQEAKGETEEEVEEAETEAEEEVSGNGAGSGAGSGIEGGYRRPTKDERVIQKGAERFLREMIDMSESSTISLTDAPSSVVDGAALAAWKAGGQRSDPRFFIRTRRQIEPSPPVKVAILVDVSSSMDELQKPSAVLSWALSSASLDLQNFAGRGQRVESCLIHWGYSARVIQSPGEMLPGIKEHSCSEGTSAMAEALRLVKQEMPGFFDIGDQPVNRLLVQFTDWELWGHHDVTPLIGEALASGVNMLTVAPQNYRPRSSSLDAILKGCPVQRGAASLLRYDPRSPDQVWKHATEALR
jgi:hypothetical protein